MKIYTKTGDDGQTGLFSGKRVSKASPLISTYGTVDELNSFIGFALTACSLESTLYRELYLIQNDLHRVCSDLATPLEATVKIERLDRSRAERLEKLIDTLEEGLPPLTQFILAGGSELSARLHLARTVCRRAERLVVETHESGTHLNSEVLIYLNRLSDLLFVMARVANKSAGLPDVVWNKNL